MVIAFEDNGAYVDVDEGGSRWSSFPPVALKQREIEAGAEIEAGVAEGGVPKIANGVDVNGQAEIPASVQRHHLADETKSAIDTASLPLTTVTVARPARPAVDGQQIILPCAPSDKEKVGLGGNSVFIGVLSCWDNQHSPCPKRAHCLLQ